MTSFQSDLTVAINADDTETLHGILNRGADVNMRIGGMPLLQVAIKKNKNDAVEVLLERGADPEVPAEGEDAFAALHCAVKNGNEKAVELLLQYRSDPDVRSAHKATPLHVAAAMGAVAIAKMLVEGGAEVMPTDEAGKTPRDIAAAAASAATTTGQEPHFNTARYLQQVEEERGIDRESELARKEKVAHDIAVLKSHHPERYKLAPRLKV